MLLNVRITVSGFFVGLLCFLRKIGQDYFDGLLSFLTEIC